MPTSDEEIALRQRFLDAMMRDEQGREWAEEHWATAELAVELVTYLLWKRESIQQPNLDFLRCNSMSATADAVETHMKRDQEVCEMAREYLRERWSDGKELPVRRVIEPLMKDSILEVRKFGM